MIIETPAEEKSRRLRFFLSGFVKKITFEGGGKKISATKKEWKSKDFRYA